MSSKRGVDFIKAALHYSIKYGGHDVITKSFRITGGGSGRCIGEFTVNKEHTSVYGRLHGGYAATLIDNATSYALITTNSHPGVTIDLCVSFLNSAEEGEEVVVEANTVKVGKKIAFIDCVLKRKSDGKILAKGGQTKYVDFKEGAMLKQVWRSIKY